MTPDKFDKKIQDAAAQHEPPFTEEAWDAMQKVLDEKMPVKKKDKKRFWFLLLLFLMVGSGLIIIWPGKNNKPNASSNPGVQPAMPTMIDSMALLQKNSMDTSKIQQVQTSRQMELSDAQALQQPARDFLSAEKIKNLQLNKKEQPFTKWDIGVNNSIISQNNGQKEIYQPLPNLPQQQRQNISQLKQPLIPGSTHVADKEKMEVEKVTRDSVLQRTNQTAEEKKKSPAKKSGQSFLQSLGIYLAGGPDVSVVSLKNIGKLKSIYGAGISYEVNEKFTLKAGFFVEDKVYDAPPSGYHPPEDFWSNYPYLDYINADCKIYEIPLIVDYRFSQSSRQSWYASLGVSSLFMKKEKYDYFSKDPYGQVWNRSYEIDNQNKHYFSSLRLAAGYERKLNPAISISAEPYINLPLYGVGYGKVKLYSAGVLVSLKVKPFAKKQSTQKK